MDTQTQRDHTGKGLGVRTCKRYLASSELKTKLDQLTQREIDKAEKAAQKKASG